MFATAAYAQTAAPGGAPAGGPMDGLIQFAPLILLLVVGYFFLIRPQQQRLKAHQATVAGIKRGDTVVMTSGIIGKVTRVEDAEILVEIAANTQVRVVKTMVSEVRARAEIAANDAKS